MADSKTSALTENTDPQPGDLLYLSDGGVADRKIELATLGHLSYTTEAPTTGDVTGVVGTLHDVDISGITAERAFLLPTTAGIGDRVGVRISTTHATRGRELQIRTGAASDTIDGTDYSAADFTRLWQVAEYMEFMCVVANTAWITVSDRRIASRGRMTLSGIIETNSAATPTLITFDTDDASFSRGGIVDTSNNRFTARRDAVFSLSASCGNDNQVSDGNYYGIRSFVNGTGGTFISDRMQTAGMTSSNLERVETQVEIDVVATDYIDVYFISGEANTGCSNSVQRTHATVMEIL